MRAIKIDPDMTTVDAVDLPGDELEAAIREIIGGRYVRIGSGDAHYLLVQKEHANMEVPNFLYREIPAYAGKALIVGRDVAGYTDAQLTAEEVADDIRWIDGEVIF